ncbi:MAG: ubiquinone/menaquinone biosynthesis methyltransferase [bacterium]
MAYRLPSAENKARYVQEKFDQIASKYDLFNDLITQGQHRYWKRVLLRRIGITSNARGLDLCCGTGDLALGILPRLSGEGVLVAADFSANMLQAAQRRLRRHRDGGSTPVTVVLRGDAMRLPFQDDSFEFVTIGYGLRNVSHLDGCLAELLRVLRPGGVLGTLDTGRVRNRWLRPLAEFYLFRIVPRIGKLLQSGQEMFQYLPLSTVDYPHQERLRQMMEQSGFTNVKMQEFLFGASVIHLAYKPDAS